MTISESPKKEQGIVISPSSDWIMMNLSKVSISTELAALHKDGRYITVPLNIPMASIDLLELSETKTHTHEVGGVSMKEISVAGEFYKSGFVKDVYAAKCADELHIYLILNSEDDDTALQLASLQNAIQKANKQVYIEISYAIEEETFIDELTNDYIKIPRR